MLRIVALLVLTAALLAGCGSSVDSWAGEQEKRLTDAGVTFPPDQARNAIVNMVSACVFKKTGDAASSRRIYVGSTQMQADWISAIDAGKMYDLADQEFCDSIPDGPLGER